MPADVTRGLAEAVDPGDRFIAGTGTRITDGVWEPMLLLWQGSRVTAVSTPLLQSVTAVNTAGVVIGDAVVGSSYRPWRYQDGQLTTLPVPETVSDGWPAGINARGDIVGRGSLKTVDRQIALRWPADRPGTVETIGPAYATADAILDDGTVVGTSAGPTDLSDSAGWVLRPDGRISWLTVPGKPRAWAVAARGNWAAGGVDDTPEEGDGTPQRWDLRTGAATPVHPAVGWRINGVTPSGAVLGDAGVGHGDREWTPLSGPKPGVSGLRAESIADNGTVVGWLLGDRVTPARWTGC
ncbi:hypothetical protein ACIG87_02830 [Micromonospora sp. NPDC051925]|uniref:hypothetical protein n=1 Tax=Micromonospora sp. NPDC051925 TaxID=3364288 RepID=UPI0037C7F6A1